MRALYSRFFLSDLHVHTAADNDHGYGSDAGAREPNRAFAEKLIDAHAAAGVEVIAVTDHNRVDWWPLLREAGRRRGVIVFPGIEVNVNRCHLIGIWEADRNGYVLAERFVTTLFKPGVSPFLNGAPRPVTDHSIADVLDVIRSHHGLVFAPHSTAKEIGIFGPRVSSNSRELTQGDRIAAFDVFGNRGADVLTNPSAEFQAEPARWFMSGDVRTWEGVGKRAVWLKLGAKPTLEGIRQAFLATSTRVRFREEHRPDWGRVKGIAFARSILPTWPRLTSLRVEGGFHDGFDIALAPGLNAIIGGKGSGKSALIEILRHLLALPAPEDDRLVENRATNFRADADGWLEFVDASGTPYQVHRSGGGGPPQLISDGHPSELALARRLTVRVFGQRELADLSNGSKLREFVAIRGESWEKAREEERALLRELAGNATQMRTEEEAVGGFDELSAERADLMDRITRARAAGADVLVSRLRGLETADQQVKTALAWPARLTAAAVNLRALSATPALPTEPPPPSNLGRALSALGISTTTAASTLEKALSIADPELASTRVAWESATDTAREELERGLAAAGVDNPQELAHWHTRAAELDAVLAELPAREADLVRLASARGALLAKLAAHRRKMSRLVSAAAVEIQASLPSRVRLQVDPLSDRSAVLRGLERAVSKQGVRIDQLSHLSRMEPAVLIDTIRQGPQAVIAVGVTSATATKLCALGEEDLRKLETIETPDTVRLEMELPGPTGGIWRPVADVSPGQRATASLSLALAVGTEPLIIDQPEDDLDNRYIYDEVVKTLAEVCEHRQVIVATHNANIPVLGDAELVIALDADAAQSRVVACGGLESPEVAMEARKVLEGGDEAFRARQRRYLAAR